MSKAPPAFPLYVGDFIVGTRNFDAEETGAYFLLLLFQWAHGGVPDDLAEIQKIWRLDPRRVRRLWRKIAGKFHLDADGLWRNARLEIERAKQRERSELASIKARRRWARTNARVDAGAYAGAMPGQCISVRTYVQPGTVDRTDDPKVRTSRVGKASALRADRPPTTTENDHDDTGTGDVAPAVRDRRGTDGRGARLRRMESPDDRPLDRIAVGGAAPVAVEPGDRPLRVDVPPAAAPDTGTATGTDARRPDDPPADGTAVGVDDTGRGPRDADRDRLRMLKARIRDPKPAVHADPRARRRPRNVGHS